MQRDGRVEIGLGRLHLHRDRYRVRDFGGVLMRMTATANRMSLRASGTVSLR